jgi:hypothetical protein
MVEADLVDGKIGDVGSYDVEFKGGKLVAKAGVAHDPAAGVSLKADVSIEIGAAAVLDALAKAIPGTFDDALISLAKGALGVK